MQILDFQGVITRRRAQYLLWLDLGGVDWRDLLCVLGSCIGLRSLPPDALCVMRILLPRAPRILSGANL